MVSKGTEDWIYATVFVLVVVVGTVSIMVVTGPSGDAIYSVDVVVTDSGKLDTYHSLIGRSWIRNTLNMSSLLKSKDYRLYFAEWVYSNGSFEIIDSAVYYFNYDSLMSNEGMGTFQLETMNVTLKVID